jgi:hypothetical protein
MLCRIFKVDIKNLSVLTLDGTASLIKDTPHRILQLYQKPKAMPGISMISHFVPDGFRFMVL